MFGQRYLKSKTLEVEEYVDDSIRPSKIYNAFKISFDSEIEKVTGYDNIFIVVLSKLYNEKAVNCSGTNVYGVSRVSGSIVWRMQDPRVIYATIAHDNDNMVANITGVRGNYLFFYALTYSALKCAFDYKTGKLLSCERMSYVYYRNILKSFGTQAFELCFKYEVGNVIKHNDIFVVLLSSSYSNGKVRNDLCNNIYGVNFDGKIVWRIQDPRQLHGKYDAMPSLYINIERDEDNTFCATCFDEIQFMFDYRTGKLLGFRQLRFGMPYSDEFTKFCMN